MNAPMIRTQTLPVPGMWLASILAPVLLGLFRDASVSRAEAEQPTWSLASSVPVSEITASPGSTKVMHVEKDRYYLGGPGFFECRTLRDGRRVWRQETPRERGWLGVSISTVGGGVGISAILDYPARNAGLKKDDVLTKINGHPVRDTSTVIKLIGSSEVGAKVTIEYVRAGETRTVVATLGARPQTRRFLGAGNGCLWFAYGYNVYALNRDTGRILWNEKVMPHPESQGIILPVEDQWSDAIASCGLAKGTNLLIILCVGGKRILALDALTGRPEWSYDPPRPMLSLPVSHGQVVAVVSADTDYVELLKAKDGTQAMRMAVPFRMESAAAATVIPGNQGLIVIGPTVMARTSPDFKRLTWQVNLPGLVVDTPFLMDNIAAFMLGDVLHFYSLDHGRHTWQFSMAGLREAKNISSSRRFVALPKPGGVTVLIQPREQRKVWTYRIEEPVDVTYPFIYEAFGGVLLAAQIRKKDDVKAVSFRVIRLMEGKPLYKLERKGVLLHVARGDSGLVFITDQEVGAFCPRKVNSARE